MANSDIMAMMKMKKNKCIFYSFPLSLSNEREDNEESPEKRQVNTCVDDLSGDNDTEV
jgi:hypothetical protein